MISSSSGGSAGGVGIAVGGQASSSGTEAQMSMGGFSVGLAGGDVRGASNSKRSSSTVTETKTVMMSGGNTANQSDGGSMGGSLSLAMQPNLQSTTTRTIETRTITGGPVESVLIDRATGAVVSG